MVPASELEKIPELPLIASAQVEPLTKPVVVGHYTLFGVLKCQSPKVACVDYNASKGGNPLVGYRFELPVDNSDAIELDDDQFTFAFKRDLEESAANGKAKLLEDYLATLPAIGDHEREKYQPLLNHISDKLRLEWDPLGVGSEPDMQDEYNDYVPTVLQLLWHSEPNVLAFYLLVCEQEYIGVERQEAEMLSGLVANQLFHLCKVAPVSQGQ